MREPYQHRRLLSEFSQSCMAVGPCQSERKLSDYVGHARMMAMTLGSQSRMFGIPPHRNQGDRPCFAAVVRQRLLDHPLRFASRRPISGCHAGSFSGGLYGLALLGLISAFVCAFFLHIPTARVLPARQHASQGYGALMRVPMLLQVNSPCPRQGAARADRLRTR